MKIEARNYVYHKEDEEQIFDLNKWDNFLAYFRIDPEENIRLYRQYREEITIKAKEVPGYKTQFESLTIDIDGANALVSLFFPALSNTGRIVAVTKH